MLKVVVFDGGWGGELVADYLEAEPNIVEVVRVIDWRGNYSEKTDNELYENIEPILRDYVGKCDLIVLGGHTVSRVLTRLRKRYPRQLFAGMNENIKKNVRLGTRMFRRVTVLTGRTIREHGLEQDLTRQFPAAKVSFVDCEDWEELIDNNIMTKDLLYARLKKDFKLRSLRFEEREASMESMPLGVRIKIEKARGRHDKSIESTVNRFAEMRQAAREFEKCTAENMMREANGTMSLPELVIVLNTHYWEIEGSLEEIFGWRTRIVDMREGLLHNVCAALRLTGLDGKRPK